MDEPIHDGDPSVLHIMNKREEKAHWERVARWGGRGVVLFLAIAVAFLLGVIYQNRDLPDLVDAQRTQFLQCKDVPAGTAGCNTPVVSEKDVRDAKEGQRGLPGIPGRPGPVGPTGPQGPGPSSVQVFAAVRSQLAAAIATNCGGSCKGEAAPPAVNGKDGATGGQGPKGDRGEQGGQGPKGENGSDGKEGPAGTPAPIITNIVCSNSDGIFTFDNGNSITVAGMCPQPVIETPAQESR